MTAPPEHVQSVAAQLRTPALCLDAAAIGHNVQRFQSRCRASGATWMPHLKTTKSLEAANLLLAGGVREAKVATLSELRLALEASHDARRFERVLWAYPQRGPALSAAIAAAKAEPRVDLLANDPAHADTLLAELGRPVDGRARVWLDVDVGMGRTGSPPERWAQWSAPARGVAGLHGYEGHVLDPATAQAAETAGAYRALQDLRGHLGLRGLVTSGTPSAGAALDFRFGEGHRVSPGTLVLGDRACASVLAEEGLHAAAWVATRVVAVDGRRITVDAGSKSIAPDLGCAGAWHPDWEATAVSEEHRVFTVAPGAPPPSEGDVRWLLPGHVCTTVACHRRAVWLHPEAPPSELRIDPFRTEQSYLRAGP